MELESNTWPMAKGLEVEVVCQRPWIVWCWLTQVHLETCRKMLVVLLFFLFVLKIINKHYFHYDFFH